jgi:hypothetical protein
MKGDKPRLIAYAVRDPVGEEGKATWTRIGAAWAHEKGRGYSVRLDALPVDGRIVLAEPLDGAKPGSEAT